MVLKKKECPKCKQKVRKLYKVKDGFFCWKCHLGEITQMPYVMSKTLEESLKKTYTVKSHFNKVKNGDYLHGYLYLPKVLAGKRVKISVVREK